MWTSLFPDKWMTFTAPANEREGSRTMFVSTQRFILEFAWVSFWLFGIVSDAISGMYSTVWNDKWISPQCVPGEIICCLEAILHESQVKLLICRMLESLIEACFTTSHFYPRLFKKAIYTLCICIQPDGYVFYPITHYKYYCPEVLSIPPKHHTGFSEHVWFKKKKKSRAPKVWSI